MIYETNFKKIVKLGILDRIAVDENFHMKSEGFMDLVVEVLRIEEKYTDISMAHYFEQNGDLMADPEMEVRIYQETGAVEALSYKQDSLGIEQRVYKTVLDKGNPQIYVNMNYKKSANQFLGQWLTNLINQGF